MCVDEKFFFNREKYCWNKTVAWQESCKLCTRDINFYWLVYWLEVRSYKHRWLPKIGTYGRYKKVYKIVLKNRKTKFRATSDTLKLSDDKRKKGGKDLFQMDAHFTHSRTKRITFRRCKVLFERIRSTMDETWIRYYTVEPKRWRQMTSGATKTHNSVRKFMASIF